jgi:hypothetical protein
MTTFLGKYRGKVVDNIDPLLLGRLIVLVPAVSEFPLSWAMPCVPYAGRNVGFFALPPIAANVWVEFEQGDPNYAIWSGCFWGDGEVPAKSAVPTTKVIRTETITFEIDDLQPSVSLEVLTPSGPVKFAQGPDGITLTIGTTSRKISI